jgi:hypothetical protein
MPVNIIRAKKVENKNKIRMQNSKIKNDGQQILTLVLTEFSKIWRVYALISGAQRNSP